MNKCSKCNSEDIQKNGFTHVSSRAGFQELLVRIIGVSNVAVLKWVKQAAAKEKPLKLSKWMKCGIIWVKKRKLWVWVAFDRTTKRVLGWQIGNRNAFTGKNSLSS